MKKDTKAITPSVKNKPWSKISKAETLEQFKEEVAATAEVADLVRIKKLDDLIVEVLNYLSDPERLKETKSKDLAVILGILVDKRQLALDTYVKKRPSNLRLRAVFRGEGTVEVETQE
jgi:hypothetical protein